VPIEEEAGVIETEQDCISVLEYFLGFRPYSVICKQLLCHQRLIRRLVLTEFKRFFYNTILSTGSLLEKLEHDAVYGLEEILEGITGLDVQGEHKVFP
jgi:hypothetical protein